MRLRTPSISYSVAGLGVAVSLLGWLITPGPFAYGVVGFGLAHVILGLLDLYRTGNGGP